mgnify:FL=1
MDRTQKRESRGLCLQILFANNFSENNFEELLDNFFVSTDIDLERNSFTPKQIEYASQLYAAVLKGKDNVDKIIEEKLVNWEMSRLAIMDMMILRMSISEMLFIDDIPPKVSITEAVEIAKEYSSKDSSSFVNGIMDAVYNENYKSLKKKKYEN